MLNKRIKYSDNQHSILYAETGGICPLCSEAIMFTKPNSDKPTKSYELAHIYPLNPTSAQINILLKYPAPLDINSIENLIALCPSCHTKYDKDFKLEELVKLQDIKNIFLKDSKAKLFIAKNVLPDEVCEILDLIINYDVDECDSELINLNLSTVSQKLKNGMDKNKVRQIKYNAADFYVRIKNHIKQLEQIDQLAVKIMQNQINTYYLLMKREHSNNKDLIFRYISEWISHRSGKSILALEILVSFFIQNCEVFDVDSN